MWFGKNDDEAWERIDAVRADFNVKMESLRDEIAALKRAQDALSAALVTQKAKLDPEQEGRLTKLEARSAELWRLLTEESPATGRPKKSSLGRTIAGFYGKN